MNTVATFFEQNIIFVFFLYGLAFYSMGLALALASRRTSRFRLAKAIQPLSAFALMHGTNEWLHMIEKIAVLYNPLPLPLWFHIFHVGLLVSSFVMLVAFGLLLLTPFDVTLRDIWLSVWGLFGFWSLNVLAATIVYHMNPDGILTIADIFARYILGIPGALFGAWGLLKQRRILQQLNLPKFGRDLAISALALIGYGVIGQLFVGETFLFPSNVVNSGLFFDWFGFPVQLLRAGFATIIAVFMARAVNIFEVEQRAKLYEAQQAKLDSERRRNAEKDTLNKALQSKTQELAVLLEISNVLAHPYSQNRQRELVLRTIIEHLSVFDTAMLMLRHQYSDPLMTVSAGFENASPNLFGMAQQLGKQCVESGQSICRYRDGTQRSLAQSERPPAQLSTAQSPLELLALPIRTEQATIGCLVLAQIESSVGTHLPITEYNLLLGINQQLALSMENIRLQLDVERHEEILSTLLDRVVDAQENERKRIARELHDATGQSLSAIGLGLRGVESLIGKKPEAAAANIQQLKKYSADALKELRRIIANLRPSQLDDLGLEPTLQWYIHEFERQYDIPVNIDISYEKGLLSSTDETALFRITQEALINIAKHAHAKSVSVSLQKRNGEILLYIADDGIGFDTSTVQKEHVPRRGWGLLGIQERVQLLGGTCSIFSEPDAGTQLKVSISTKLRSQKKNVKNKVVAG